MADIYEISNDILLAHFLDCDMAESGFCRVIGSWFA